MPEVASRLIAFQYNPKAGLSELAAIVSLDVSLASTVLRHANSPAYNLAGKVETVERAALVIGYEAVRTMALTLSISKAMAEQPGGSLNYTTFWQRSLLAAASARVLGQTVKENALDELFLAALLQDIGMLALDRVRPELYRTLDVPQTDHQGLCVFEKAVLNFDHARFGGALLQEWGMHNRTVKAILESHDDHANDVDHFAACVAASGVIADFFLQGGGSEAYARVSHELYRLFSIRDSQCMQVLLQASEAVRNNIGLYGEVMDAIGLVDVASSVSGTKESSSEFEEDEQDFERISRHHLLDSNLEAEGLMGRGAFEKSLKNSFYMLRGQPVSVAMVSINNLRALHGQYGDRVVALLLKVISRKLSDSLRVEDFVTRYGDTFAILLLGSTAENAVKVVERIVQQFEDARYAIADGSRVALLINGGVAGSSASLHFGSEQQLLNRAALALSYAQQAGDYSICEEIPEAQLMEIV
ncbi:GGDEF domain-containing protein [Litorivivens lipolytica]|uniref:GGDEF domain-containing protein n=1 Tax=Litorivivens lipolytica TaxID=1524264 RepID=UPI001FE81582|nr:GGDEF domain-containing protein [Litorivivens lipolytica]